MSRWCQYHYPFYYTHMFGNYYKPNCGFLGVCRVWRSGILCYLWLVRIEETEKQHGNDNSGESHQQITSNLKWKLGSYGDEDLSGNGKKMESTILFRLYQNFSLCFHRHRNYVTRVQSNKARNLRIIPPLQLYTYTPRILASKAYTLKPKLKFPNLQL